MRIAILAMFLSLAACGGSESADDRDAAAATSAGEEIQQQYNEALDKAAEVEDLMQQQKEDIDEAVDEASN